jgi:hypothetical protein
LYSHKLIARMRVDAGSCGSGVASTAVESDADEEVASTSIADIVPGGTSVPEV